MRAEELCAIRFADAHPIEAGRRLEAMPAEASVAFLQGVSQETAAAILMSMHAVAAGECLAGLPAPQVAAVVGDIPTEQTARMLRAMPSATAETVLRAVPDVRRREIDRTLSYPANSAGAIMEPAVLTVTDDLVVQDARKVFRRVAHSSYFYVYVVRREGRLVGVLDLRELFKADKGDPVISAMHHNPVSISPSTDLESLAQHPMWKEVDALPVTDHQSNLIGLVRHRTLRRFIGQAGEVRFDQIGATLTSIGELYWATMGTLLAALGSVVVPDRRRHPRPVRKP